MSARISARNSPTLGQSRPGHATGHCTSQPVLQMIRLSPMALPLRVPILNESSLAQGDDIAAGEARLHVWLQLSGSGEAVAGKRKAVRSLLSYRNGPLRLTVPPSRFERPTFGTGNQRLGVFWERFGAETNGNPRDHAGSGGLVITPNIHRLATVLGYSGGISW